MEYGTLNSDPRERRKIAERERERERESERREFPTVENDNKRTNNAAAHDRWHWQLWTAILVASWATGR